MVYSKPEAAVLGDAAGVIQGVVKGQGVALDQMTGKHNYPPPAYDLDE